VRGGLIQNLAERHELPCFPYSFLIRATPAVFPPAGMVGHHERPRPACLHMEIVCSPRVESPPGALPVQSGRGRSRSAFQGATPWLGGGGGASPVAPEAVAQAPKFAGGAGFLPRCGPTIAAPLVAPFVHAYRLTSLICRAAGSGHGLAVREPEEGHAGPPWGGPRAASVPAQEDRGRGPGAREGWGTGGDAAARQRGAWDSEPGALPREPGRAGCRVRASTSDASRGAQAGAARLAWGCGCAGSFDTEDRGGEAAAGGPPTRAGRVSHEEDDAAAPAADAHHLRAHDAGAWPSFSARCHTLCESADLICVWCISSQPMHHYNPYAHHMDYAALLPYYQQQQQLYFAAQQAYQAALMPPQPMPVVVPQAPPPRRAAAPASAMERPAVRSRSLSPKRHGMSHVFGRLEAVEFRDEFGVDLDLDQLNRCCSATQPTAATESPVPPPMANPHTNPNPSSASASSLDPSSEASSEVDAGELEVEEGPQPDVEVSPLPPRAEAGRVVEEVKAEEPPVAVAGPGAVPEREKGHHHKGWKRGGRGSSYHRYSPYHAAENGNQDQGNVELKADTPSDPDRQPPGGKGAEGTGMRGGGRRPFEPRGRGRGRFRGGRGRFSGEGRGEKGQYRGQATQWVFVKSQQQPPSGSN
jgi:hypothetical protein